MIAFANKNENLTVIKGSVVYELPMKSAEKAEMFAKKINDDDLFSEAISIACTSTPRVGNRTELESKDSPAMRVWAGRKW